MHTCTQSSVQVASQQSPLPTPAHTVFWPGSLTTVPTAPYAHLHTQSSGQVASQQSPLPTPAHTVFWPGSLTTVPTAHTCTYGLLAMKPRCCWDIKTMQPCDVPIAHMHTQALSVHTTVHRYSLLPIQPQHCRDFEQPTNNNAALWWSHCPHANLHTHRHYQYIQQSIDTVFSTAHM